MKTKKTVFALLSGLLLTAALVGSPVFAADMDSDHSGAGYSIFNIPTDRAS